MANTSVYTGSDGAVLLARDLPQCLPERFLQAHAGFVPEQHHRTLEYARGHCLTNLPVLTVHSRPRSHFALTPPSHSRGSPRNPGAALVVGARERRSSHPWRLCQMSDLGPEEAADVPPQTS